MLNGAVSSVQGQRKDNTTISVALTIEINNFYIFSIGEKQDEEDKDKFNHLIL